MIPTTVSGALNIIKAAASQARIKSVVYTSDSFAALLPQSNKVIHITPAKYNEASVAAAYDRSSFEHLRENAWDSCNAVELNVYAAAKVAAEKAIWQYTSEETANCQTSTVLPNVNIGKSVGGMPLSSTGTFVPKLLAGDASGLFFPAQHFVNVRDCAKVHIAALLEARSHSESTREKRLFAMAAPFNWNDVLETIRKLRPEASVIDDLLALGRDLSILPNGQAEEMLKKWYGHGWTSLEESVRQNIEDM